MHTSKLNIRNIMEKKIVWRKMDEPAKWSAVVEGELCILSMGDFPDEPLYTVSCGNESISIDEAPSTWVISPN